MKDNAISVAVYARVSSEKQDQLNALENQKRWYMELLEKHPEWELFEMYVDEGISGTSVNKRDSFKRMIEDAKKKKFDLIVTRETSRFARNVIDCLTYAKELLKYDVGIYFVNDGINTKDSDGFFRLSLFATFAEDESRKLSQRVLAGMHTSMKKGVPLGSGNILGYDKVNGEYIINEEQAKTVRRIYDLSLQGHGLRRIKKILEDEGRKTSMGKSNWYESVISNVLDNKFYYGEVVYQKFYSLGYDNQKLVRNHGEKEFIIVQGEHQPIITKEEYDKVQELRGQRRKRVGKKQRAVGVKPNADCWSKLLVCGECGRKFGRNKWGTTKDGEARYGYQCYTQKHTGTVKTRLKRGLGIEGVCKVPYLPEWKLQLAARHVLTYCAEETEEIVEIAKTILDKALRDSEVKVKKIDKQLKEIDVKTKAIGQKKKKAFDYLLSDTISESTYKEQVALMDEELEEYAAEIEKLMIEKESALNEKETDLAIENLKMQLDSLKNFLDVPKIPDAVIETLVEKIIVYEDRLCFVLKYNGNIDVKIKGNRKNNAGIATYDGSENPRLDSDNTGNHYQFEEKVTIKAFDISPANQYRFCKTHCHMQAVRKLDEHLRFDLIL